MNDTTAPSGPVTLDDVRAALAGADPSTTNASALRKVLGRGSFGTIQKHLDTLRVEAVAPVADMQAKAPDAPKELIAAVWQAAWVQAQALTSGALAAAHVREQALSTALATARTDADAVAQDADSAQAALTELTSEVKEERYAHAQALEQAAKTHAQALEQATKGQMEAVQALEQERAAMGLERAQHAATTAALRGEVDRLVNQLGDLRAALGSRAS